ncbi:hypothetical protein MSPP1_001994 [Malassezia sp. CBS 17886]|nr:hypothetical protein MSPP1_001994 [Malassezia sp. CBS 17886]
MLGLGTIFYVTLLVINGIAILNEERFLNKIGWSASQRQLHQGFDNPSSDVKGRLVDLISAVRVLLRIPLIIVNTVVIVYELILG